MTASRTAWLRLSCGTALIASGLALTPPAAVAQGAPPATVEWQLPVEETHPPQTPAQDEAGKEHGRAVPAPELLQPSLDPALAGFQPKTVELLVAIAHGHPFGREYKFGSGSDLG